MATAAFDVPIGGKLARLALDINSLSIGFKLVFASLTLLSGFPLVLLLHLADPVVHRGQICGELFVSYSCMLRELIRNVF